MTRDVICEQSRHHYRKILDRLALHYVVLRMTLPAPTPPPGERVMRVVAREYGHPREWASDAARAIADHLNDAHDGLADHLHHEPPPHPGSREYGRVALAHHYLCSWFDDLCTYPGAGDTAEALHDLDRSVRSGLGKTNPRRFLPVPCPSCDILGLVREGADDELRVECHSCREVIPADRYEWWARNVVDEVVGEALNGEAS